MKRNCHLQFFIKNIYKFWISSEHIDEFPTFHVVIYEVGMINLKSRPKTPSRLVRPAKQQRAHSGCSTNCYARRRALAQNSSRHSVIFLMRTRVPSRVQEPRHEPPSSASQIKRRVSLAAGYVEVVCGGTPLRVALHSSWLHLPTPHPHLSSHLLISPFSYSNLPYEKSHH
jgi:hypothetical protein